MRMKHGLPTKALVPELVLAMLLSPLANAQQSEQTSQEEPAAVPQATQIPSTETRNDEPGSASAQQAQSEPTQPGNDQLPDSPGTLRKRDAQPVPSPSSEPQDSQPAQSQPQQPPQQQAPQQQSQDHPHEPLGTAAAESMPTSGIAASRPAGAALAPAKQRRVRSILIKVGALVGVGVAVGTTVALSQGSPSKPPGSN